MTDKQFQAELLEVLQSLEALGQYSQWQHLCNGALDARQLTLVDAERAIEWAVYSKTERVHIPTIEEIFGC
ncbi:hypothetical protein AB0758_44700 [Tolypothrix bouteillei VB521301_2]|uniref:Uncharacterized protein n=1 Tax=Tolypothrix bouteillei VB521301 TaxID=1479485 RepID=A0A0C1RP36_9CYAN